jgi:hypothetical protein
MFLGVLGVVIYVGPFERDFVAPSWVREFAVVDSTYNIIFGRIFGETAYSYGDTMLLAKQNGAILVARDLKVDQKTSKIYLFLYVPNL